MFRPILIPGGRKHHPEHPFPAFAGQFFAIATVITILLFVLFLSGL